MLQSVRRMISHGMDTQCLNCDKEVPKGKDRVTTACQKHVFHRGCMTAEECAQVPPSCDICGKSSCPESLKSCAENVGTYAQKCFQACFGGRTVDSICKYFFGAK